MDKKLEIAQQIAEVQARQAQNKTDRESIDDNGDKLALELERLKKELAEAGKPKLRHGECYHDGCNSMVTISTIGGWMRLYDDGVEEVQSEDDTLEIIEAFGYKSTGFMFPAVDDLKAIQEDVTEFEIGDFNKLDMTFKAHKSPDIALELVWPIHASNMYIKTEDFPAFELKVRQFGATLRRQSNDNL